MFQTQLNPSITCSHIWQVDIPKCYINQIHNLWKFGEAVLPNTNADHFCDIIFRHMFILFSDSVSILQQKTVLEINNPAIYPNME